MTRKKVKLTYITNDSARKATFKKRKKGLKKKVSELSTLCDVEACAIIYSPYDSHPEIWPSPLDAQRVIAHFKSVPEMEQSKKMMNQESFLRQRIAKANEQLKKQRKENREKEVTKVMFQCLTGKSMNGLSMADLNDLGWVIDQKLRDIHCRIKNIDVAAHDQKKSQVVGGDHDVQVEQKVVVPVGGGDQNGMDQRQSNWFMEMMMNPHDHVEAMEFGGVGDDHQMALPFWDHNQINAIWSNNTFFP